jgi:hypothetical protein
MEEDRENHNQIISMGTIREIMIQELLVFREIVMIDSSSETVLQEEEAINHVSNAMKKVISRKIVRKLDQEWAEDQGEKAAITVVNQVTL